MTKEEEEEEKRKKAEEEENRRKEEESEEEEEDGSLEYEIDVSVDEDEKKALIKSLLDANPGKGEDDLKDEIAAKEAELLKQKKDQAEEDFKLIDEVKSRDGNEEMSDEDAWEIVQKEQEQKRKDENKGGDVGDPDDPFADLDDDEDDKNKDLDGKALERVAKAEQRVKDLEDQLNDPVISQYMQFKESGGGDFRKFLEKLEVGVDYSALPAKEIYRLGMKSLVDSKDMTQEDMDAAMQDFDSMPVQERAKTVRDFRNSLISDQSKRLEGLKFGNPEAQKEMQEKRKKNHEAFVSLADSMVGRTYHGVKITAEMSKSIVENVQSGGIGFVNKDGTVNVKKMFDFAAWNLYKVDVLRENAQKHQNKGRKQEITKRSAPKRTGVKSGSMGSRANDHAAYQKAREEQRKKRGHEGKVTF